MPRLLPRFRPSPSRVVAVLVAAALWVPSLARAVDVVLIDPGPLTRKFPENDYCPLPVTYSFTPSGDQVTIHVQANVYVDNFGTIEWVRQSLDNVVVAPTTLHDANSVDNVEYQSCYNDIMVPKILEFDRPAMAVAPLRELFDLSAGGWDLTEGAYYNAATRSADRDPSNTSSPHDTTGGSLGLGPDSGSQSLTEIAKSSKIVTGLTAGVSYTLSGWWYVGPDCIASDDVFMKFTVTEPSTAVRRSRWGAVKIRYR